MNPKRDLYDFVSVASGVAGALSACKVLQRPDVTV